MSEPIEAGRRRRGQRVGRHTSPAGARSHRHRSHRTRPQAPIGARIRYRLDRSLTRGPLALIGWLAAATFGAVLGASLLAMALGASFGGSRDESFAEDLWQSVLRTVNDGIFGRDNQWTARLLGLGLTLVGIFLAGALIGVIATAIDHRVQQLRKGRSRLLEHHHSLILGWSTHVPVIVRELLTCHQHRRDRAVVILADRSMTEMDDALRDLASKRRSTRVVCRTGDPSKPDDLELVNIAGARSVIVVQGDQGDAGTVKTVLAIRTLDPEFARGHIVVEVENRQHAETLEMLTDGAVVAVNADDVVAEVVAQACHQEGLSAVFRELLDFDGDEIHFAEVPELVGHTYGRVLRAFDEASVIGRLSRDGLVELNPDPDVVFEPGDQVIAVAEDDNHIDFTGFVDIAVPAPAASTMPAQRLSRVLVVGWSTIGPRVLQALDEASSVGSYLEVAVDPDVADVSNLDQISLRNASLHVSPTTAGAEYLMGLGAGDPFDQIVVLGYREKIDVAHADAGTLLTLLALRKLWPADASPASGSSPSSSTSRTSRSPAPPGSTTSS